MKKLFGILGLATMFSLVPGIGMGEVDVNSSNVTVNLTYGSADNLTVNGDATLGTTSSNTVTISGEVTIGSTLDVTGAATAATLNTGQGANELYDMDQNVDTTATPTFEDVTADDVNFHETMYLGLTTAISSFTPTAITTDDGCLVTVSSSAHVSGNVVITGNVSSEDSLADDAVVHESLYMGETDAISTFTPTALTLDNGLTLTANGNIVADANITTTGDDVDFSTHVTIAGNLSITGSNAITTDTDDVDISTHVAVSGTITMSGTIAPIVFGGVFDVAVDSPTVAHALAIDGATHVIYISDGTGALTNWIKVGGQ